CYYRICVNAVERPECRGCPPIDDSISSTVGVLCKTVDFMHIDAAILWTQTPTGVVGRGGGQASSSYRLVTHGVLMLAPHYLLLGT
ncbi:hypothetical protein J6590_012769, partial [Homalodisca vitripennis]